MEKKRLILIVEDEKNTREGLRKALKKNYEILLADSAEQALELINQHDIDLILSDLRLPGMDGLSLVRRAMSHNSQPVCILLTAYGSVETAVEAMKSGAYDYLTKPVNLDELELVIQKALKSANLQKENIALRTQLDEKYGLENIVGRSEPMEQMFDLLKQVAPSRATVLIQGESGTGKELVAHAIHNLSPRKQGPFVAVHCAGLPETLLESELFGHEKGSFTGASERRRGRFELAEGGSLFLDEISEISASTQVKLLRVLEERAFERVGGQESISVDIRLIAATNKNLEELVEQGKFRNDLFFRLNVVNINIPPLRERRDDIPLLVKHFATQIARENNKEIEITPDTLNAMTLYPWPGNVRELRNIIERMIVLCRSGKLTMRDLPPQFKNQPKNNTAFPGTQSQNTMPGASLQEINKQLIIAALQANDNNKTKTAKQLGISRRTMHRKLHEYGLA